MKIYFDDILILDQGYQEILVDKSNFQPIKYTSLIKQNLSIGGLMHEGVYILEPLNYYKIHLKNEIVFSVNGEPLLKRSNVSFEGKEFIPSSRLLEAGLIFSQIDLKTQSVFVYNCTHNHIYVKEDIEIGEVK